MADNSSNILKQLQDYEATPPAGAFEKAWGAVLLQHKDKAPASSTNVFQQLQDYNMQAPTLDFKKITSTEKTAPVKVIPSQKQILLRVAAVLLLVAACSAGYWVFFKQQNNPEEYTLSPNNKPDTPVIAVAKNEFPDKTSNEAGVSTPSKQNNHKTAAAIPNIESSKTKKTISKGIQYSRGGSMGFYNNDILFTLVNYKEYGREKVFKKALADKTITLNKYSYINISDRMTAMLQDLYLTKKNGKASRKAKKTKRKFEKWRKKDEKYFDKKIKKNPADIIDLTDFLMDN